MADYVISAWHPMGDDYRETNNAFEVDGMVAELAEMFPPSNITITRDGEEIPLERVPEFAWMEMAV